MWSNLWQHVLGIKSALAEYEQWIGEEISEELQESHQKALDIVNSCNKYENELVSTILCSHTC